MDFEAKILIIKNSENDLVILEDNQNLQEKIRK